MADKDILESVQSSKNIIVADSDDENEMNNAVHVPIPKATLSYDMHAYDFRMQKVCQFQPVSNPKSWVYEASTLPPSHQAD
ncbi:hypothetical protein TNCV_1269321 [Trichonephila clavipes]|nr:hypothetical protein TNCV_1269321 [Trichonephila clavipes]